MEVNNNLSEKAQRDFYLVQKATKGDQKAYSELMDRYRDAIYFMLLKMVNNASDAEDLTIEAFGKAFKNLEQYAPNYAFSTWLFKIATNNCIDFIRKKKANTVSLDQNDDDSDKAPTDIMASILDPEESMIKDQKLKIMRNIVSRLKPPIQKTYRTQVF
jgi:RNA polymerase sigma factor (sigma-70 family)